MDSLYKDETVVKRSYLHNGNPSAGKKLSHYTDVIMGAIASQITSLTQPLIQAQIKENIKAPPHWPLWGEFTGDRWITRINGQ